MRTRMVVVGLTALACAGIGSEVEPQPVGAGGGAAGQVAVGRCLQGDDVVSCDGDHDHEVFHRFSLPDPRPAEDALDDVAEAACEAAFEAFVGRAPGLSRYGITWLVPDEAEAPVVTCALFTAQPTTGSAQGTGR